MKSSIFFLLILIALTGCYETSYQPNYIISQEDLMELEAGLIVDGKRLDY